MVAMAICRMVVRVVRIGYWVGADGSEGAGVDGGVVEDESVEAGAETSEELLSEAADESDPEVTEAGSVVSAGAEAVVSAAGADAVLSVSSLEVATVSEGAAVVVVPFPFEGA